MLDTYEVLQVIGKGSFGVVSKIRRKADGKVRVLRIMMIFILNSYRVCHIAYMYVYTSFSCVTIVFYEL